MELRIIWCLLLGVAVVSSLSTSTESSTSNSNLNSNSKPKPKVRRSNYYLSNGAIPYKFLELRSAPTMASYSFPKSEIVTSPLLNSFSPFEMSMKLMPESSKMFTKTYKSSNFPTKFEPKLSVRPSSMGTVKSYPEIKSISISPSAVSSGGFKPISPPQFQSNPQLSGPLRIYEDSYQSYGNPTTSSLENLSAYPILPTIRTNLPFAPTQAVPKITNDNYQLFSAQPQLHFGKAIPVSHQPVYHSQPFGRIKSDVEVISKRPQMPFPDSEEDKSIPVSEESYEPLQSVKNLPNDHKFEFPESSVFKSYDEAFGKLYHTSKSPSTSPKTLEKPPQYGVPSSQAEKHVYEHSDEYSSASNENSPETQGKYSEEGSDAEKPNFENFGRDYNQDFEESYHPEVPREEYKQVREVPKIGKTNSQAKIRARQQTRRTKPFKNYFVEEPKVDETSYERIVAKIEGDSFETQAPVENFGYKIPKSSRTTGFNNEQTTEPSKQQKNSRNYSSRNNELRKTTNQFNAPSSQVKSLDQSPSVENVLVLPFIYHDNLKSNYQLLNDPVG